ncbi:hypothetical protein N7520_002293 [Penicillium odoratum]|uniref:uncharacterized protein n=1 Tax=Penicillium odoratum TaxID=1167516 RepID=UPI002547945D|nr:uncharacterized protein N7520_002293 [Penicillium odoratum]KAJ5771764.1 hypothetical protein N7520_002293 [Penicillium odoratum]
MGPPNSPASPRSFPGQHDIDLFDYLRHEQLNDSMRGLSLLDLQNLNPGVVDAHRIVIVETMGI